MPTTIKSLNYDEQEIIRDILTLHSPSQRIDCDPTFSAGNFYKKGLDRPQFIFDKFPQTEDTIEATSDNLPLGEESVETIMFDPPFIIGGKKFKESKDGSCVIGKRFHQFEKWQELKDMYSSSLKEFYRILKPEGIVIFKCQDTVSSSKQYFTHVYVMQEAIAQGFYPKDLFILGAKNRIIGKITKQQHARKFHSYYWVFKKTNTKINYI